MSIEIRNIEPGDLATVIKLMREFAAYEKLEKYLEVTEDRLAAALFAEGSYVEGLIAHDGGNAVGYAIFYPNFVTFRGQRGFFLEDLFVSKRHRSTGVGKALLEQIARMAAERGFERIDFLVLDWNEPALGFYKKLGAEVSEGESHLKFSDKAFRGLANG